MNKMESDQKYVEMSKSAPKENFWRKFSNYFEEYTALTGIHGLRYLTEKRSPLEKIFWILVLLLSIAGCLVMISLIVQKYQDSPVVVSFDTKDIPIYEIPFPAVTICPESKCLEEKFNYSRVFMKMLGLGRLSANESYYFTYASMLCNDFDQNTWLRNSNKSVDNNFFKLIDEIKPDNEMTLCKYMGETVECSELFTPIIIDEGICYTFNILDRKDIFKENVMFYKNFHNVSSRSPNYNNDEGYPQGAEAVTYPNRGLMSGADNALQIDFRHKMYITDFVCNQYLQGYRILLHNPAEIPRLSKFYFRVPLDSTVVAAVEPTLIRTSDAIKKFSPEVKNCYAGNERPLKYFKIYTQSNCLLECLTNATLQECGCVKYYMPRNDNGTKICGIGSNHCVGNVEQSIKINNTRAAAGINCGCISSCTSLSYRVETSTSHYYYKEYLDLRNTTTLLDMQQYHYSILSVYFKVDQFIGIKRNELYGTSDLISNFGGLLGLFTGFSVISLVEIVYFASMRIMYNRRLYGTWFAQQK